MCYPLPLRWWRHLWTAPNVHIYNLPNWVSISIQCEAGDCFATVPVWTNNWRWLKMRDQPFGYSDPVSHKKVGKLLTWFPPFLGKIWKNAKWSYLRNGKDIKDALVLKFLYWRGLSPALSWKWPSPTLSTFVGLFQLKKKLFLRLSQWVSLARICLHLTLLNVGKKKIAVLAKMCGTAKFVRKLFIYVN